MKRYIQTIIYLLIIAFSSGLSAQHFEKKIDLFWKGIITEHPSEDITVQYLYFENASVDPSSSLPVYSEYFNIDKSNTDIQCELHNVVFTPVNPEEKTFLEKLDYNYPAVRIQKEIFISKKNPVLSVSFVPIRLNPESGSFEKLISFELKISALEGEQKASRPSNRMYANQSLLESGDWYKLKVSENGIYQVTHDDLVSYGIDPGSIDPTHIRIYGNAGGMLPEKNSLFRYDDLQENSIFVQGENDGSFDAEDYILFYGMSPHTWYTALGFFLQQVHYYDDFNYYYLTTSLGAGQRIEMEAQATGNISSTITAFNDYKIVEDESHSLIESGKTWYGDEFGETNSRLYQFHFPNIVPEEEVAIKTSVANRTYINDKMVIGVNGEYTDSVTLTSISVNTTKFAQKKKKTNYYTNLGPEINVQLDYLQAEPGSRMWLNFINVNVISKLRLDEGQLQFRELSCIVEGGITNFIVENTDSDTRIWDVTNPIVPLEMELTINDNETSFIVSTDSLREFVAFDGSVFKSAEFVSEVVNQDLHGSGPFDLIIVTHLLFWSQAEQLAQLHQELDGFKVLIVTPETIYNEFSSGKQDPTAIRDLLKMYYDKFEGEEPRYLLLLGDGSFDAKDRIEHNTNFIPTFQTWESWISATSYVVDDYFGLLDDDEGDDASGYLDVGIGRLPVQTAEEAQQMVDKILRYLAPEEPQFGKWRTKVCMIADDEDGNLHLEQADSLASGTGYVTPLYNQNKIYLDAFPQLKTPSGDKYPDVTERINQQVDEGALIINYIGHGGTGGWAHERILQQNDMLNWENTYKLPMFITATCEFSRFDEPDIVSGGELVILNPIGGGIALFTTTRLAYSQSNFRLNQRLYARAFTAVDGEMPYLGDLIRESKPPGQLTTRNFVLLGDPALKLSYPKYNIKTLSINGVQLEEIVQDTVMSLQELTIAGEIEDLSGNPITNFNGFVFPVLYDKPTTYKTIGNDQSSFPIEFHNQDKVIWEGKATVTEGKFTFTFVIPLDIAFHFGNAKISYYAFSDTEDASGYYNDIVLGGIDQNADPDLTGPDIKLFINDTTFVSGDLTHENPKLLAYLSDEHGINRSHNGIGHDITLILDHDYSNVMVMNQYYESTSDDFRMGYLEYPFYNLPNGTHTLTLKAWDSYNNSSLSTIEFIIDKDSKLSLFEVKNYPNPFIEQTTFTFQHTRPGNELDIVLTIYDLTGRYILSYATKIQSLSTEVPFLTWNGRDVNGAKLHQGVYLYTVQVTDEIGQEAILRQKLILGY